MVSRPWLKQELPFARISCSFLSVLAAEQAIRPNSQMTAGRKPVSGRLNRSSTPDRIAPNPRHRVSGQSTIGRKSQDKIHKPM
jgi:hypothetical protein